MLERGADDSLAAAVIDDVTDAPLLGAIADATAVRPGLAIVVLGPTAPNVDTLIALASGASAYLPSGTPAARWPMRPGTCSPARSCFRRRSRPRSCWDCAARGRGVVVDGADGRSVVLTHREWEVLVLLRQARTTAEIARRFVVSAGTVRTHVGSIVRKLGVEGRAALSG